MAPYYLLLIASLLLATAAGLSVTLPIQGKILSIVYDHNPLSTSFDRAPLYAGVFLAKPTAGTALVKCEVANTMTCSATLNFAENAGVDAATVPNEVSYGFYNADSG